MKINIKTGLLIAITVIIILSSAVYTYHWYRNLDLNYLVSTVLPDLPAHNPPNTIVEPDYIAAPINDGVYAVKGNYTIVEYRQESCRPCARLDANLEKFLKIRKDVAVRKIDLKEGWSEKSARKDYGRTIYFTPFIVIYDAEGKQFKADHGEKRKGAKLLIKWIKNELSENNISYLH